MVMIKDVEVCGRLTQHTQVKEQRLKNIIKPPYHKIGKLKT